MHAGGGGWQATTVDQVLDWHRDMLDSCLKECMLSNGKLLAVRSRHTGVRGEAPTAWLTHLVVKGKKL